MAVSRKAAPARQAPVKPLVDKLGVKAGQRVAYLGHVDAGLMAEIEGADARIANGLRGANFDWILLGIETAAELAELERAACAITQNGGVWIIFPKGRADLKAEHLIGAGKSCGLVDTKVVRVSERLTGLKFVIPLSRRR